MSIFTYADIVTAKEDAPVESRPGQRAWIVAIFDKRPQGEGWKKFPEGIVYLIEFEDGNAVRVHENNLKKYI